MVKSGFFKSARKDLPFSMLTAPCIGNMDPVSFWQFPRVFGCCEHFYSHLVVLCIEECRWDDRSAMPSPLDDLATSVDVS